jgi:hypothetical protein
MATHIDVSRDVHSLSEACSKPLTTWCDQDDHVYEKPVDDHGDGVANTAHARRVDFRRIQEGDAEERYALSSIRIRLESRDMREDSRRRGDSQR